MDWQPIAARLAAPRSLTPPERPASLEAIISVSERLSAPTDFVRVDLYDVGGRIVFGEMTSYPLGGAIRFDPPEWERIVGSWWHVPRWYT